VVVAALVGSAAVGTVAVVPIDLADGAAFSPAIALTNLPESYLVIPAMALRADADGCTFGAT
jgi:hypothetical protein